MSSVRSSQPQQNFNVVIIGGGFAGLYMLHRVRQRGLRVRLYEAGSGIGGTWFWNRYPGARVDVESMEYSYSFDDALQHIPLLGNLHRQATGDTIDPITRIAGALFGGPLGVAFAAAAVAIKHAVSASPAPAPTLKVTTSAALQRAPWRLYCRARAPGCGVRAGARRRCSAARPTRGSTRRRSASWVVAAARRLDGRPSLCDGRRAHAGAGCRRWAPAGCGIGATD